MVYLGAGSWLLFSWLFGDRAAVRDHVVTFGLGVGALLAALLFAVPQAGTALGTAMPMTDRTDILQQLLVSQGAWVATAAVGIVGYGLSRPARRFRSPRALTYEVIALGAGAALIPAAVVHLGFLLVLVPAAVAGTAATLLEEVPRPVAVLAGLLATVAFAVTFAIARWLPFGVTELLLGVGVLAYAVGRWTDLHPASTAKPSPLLWVSLACGFVLAYMAG
jgi:type IV secretory pathway TrbD component